MLVRPGVDEHHPAGTGREIAALAPAAELLEPGKDPGHLPAATEAAGRFLRDHTPRKNTRELRPAQQPTAAAGPPGSALPAARSTRLRWRYIRWPDAADARGRKLPGGIRLS
jgi:hypothetical protein